MQTILPHRALRLISLCAAAAASLTLVGCNTASRDGVSHRPRVEHTAADQLAADTSPSSPAFYDALAQQSPVAYEDALLAVLVLTTGDAEPTHTQRLAHAAKLGWVDPAIAPAPDQAVVVGELAQLLSAALPTPEHTPSRSVIPPAWPMSRGLTGPELLAVLARAESAVGMEAMAGADTWRGEVENLQTGSAENPWTPVGKPSVNPGLSDVGAEKANTLMENPESASTNTSVPVQENAPKVVTESQPTPPIQKDPVTTAASTTPVRVTESPRVEPIPSLARPEPPAPPVSRAWVLGTPLNKPPHDDEPQEEH